MMTYEDIHLADKAKWRQFVELWQAGSVDAALNLLADTSLSGKVVNAAVLNAITSQIVSLEENDDASFKQDIIKVSPTPPTGIKQGEVYFET
mgnify:FL=1